jgi:hypothetical protein
VQLDPITSRAMSFTARRPSRRSPWLQLLAALLELAEGEAELVRHDERAWASATFAGTRHSVVLAFTGAEAVAAADRFIAALPDHEFTIAQQLVADAAVIGVEQTALPQPRMVIELQMLLLDEV